MKIAIDIGGQFKPMTGIQHYTDSLLNALYDLDTEHELTAFAPCVWSSSMLEEATKDGLFAWRRSPRARLDTVGNETIASSNRLVQALKGRTNKSRILQASRRYDLMHVPELNEFDLQARCLVATIHDTTPLTRPEAFGPGIAAQWCRFFAHVRDRYARVLTVSEFSKGDIVAHLGIPADRVDVTPLAPRSTARRVTDPQELGAALGRFGLAGVPFVLYAGSLEPRKNLLRLVEAFALAVGDGGLPDHRLVLAGGNWRRHDLELLECARQVGITGRVVTPGYVPNDEMNALMSSCAAFAYVSEYEGFGLPPLEAMACGAPVVSSDTTSLPEVVGGAGIQVDPSDVGAVAGALRLLLTDGGENARRRGLSLARAAEFSWERTARLTLQCYERAAL